MKVTQGNAMKIEEVFGIDPQEAVSLLATLTPREREVACLMAHDKRGNKYIADRLDISPKTLDIHRQNVRKKLGCTVAGLGRIWFAAQFAQGNGRVAP